jgi:hypothetical protein
MSGTSDEKRECMGYDRWLGRVIKRHLKALRVLLALSEGLLLSYSYILEE